MSEEKKDIKEVVEAAKANAFKIAKNAGMVIGGVALGAGAAYLILNGHGEKVAKVAEAAKDVVPEVVEAAI
nr:MAG TPA: hypothetical protein [Caudoviricetes sp.]